MQLLKFIQLTKVDESTHRAYGIATSEAPDKDNEICDYADTVPGYKVWSTEAFTSTTSAGQEPSLGNIRLQHGLEIAGKVTKLDFKDAEKQIWLESEPVSDKIWEMLSKGFIRGYSQGGSYLYRKCDECKEDIGGRGNYCKNCRKDVVVRYASKPSEVSYVDNPCLGEAHFSYVKSDGSLELRKFHQSSIPPETADPVAQIWPPPLSSDDKRDIIKHVTDQLKPALFPMPVEKETKTKRKAGEDLPASAFLIVGDKDDPATWHLPWKFSTDEKTKSHLRNALARFNQVKGVSADVKKKAWKRLLTLCRKHEIDVSEEEKAMASGTLKKGMYQVQLLSALLGDIRYLISLSMDESVWEDDIRDELLADRMKDWLRDGVEILVDLVQEETSELTAAAKAESEKGVIKMEDNELTKAAKGLSGHFKKAAAHHEKMAEHHKAHAEHHEEMAEEHKAMMEHHAKCMGKADVGDEHKVAHGFHKAMHGHHLKKSAVHEKMHKSHAGLAEDCDKMAVGCEETAKAATSVIPPVTDDATKAAETAALAKAAEDKAAADKVIADKAVADELAKAAGAGNEGLAKLFTETMTKMEEKFDKKFEDFGKTVEALPKGFSMVPRTGEVNKTASSGSGL